MSCLRGPLRCGMPGTTKAGKRQRPKAQTRKKIWEEGNSERPCFEKAGPKKEGVGEDVRLQAFRDQ